MRKLTIFVATVATFASAALLGSAFALKSALADNSVFKAVVHADLKNIDPIWTTAYINRNYGYMVWDTLFATDEKFEIQPQMAESATVSEDGMIYTIKLRPGLMWHDGSPVTPDDCIASIQRWGQRDGMGQQMMAVVESMEVVDDLTFTIKLKETWGLVLPALGKMSSNVPFMMPKRLAETDPFEQVPDSIGSGPYVFVKDEWVPGDKVVYTKNQAYVPRDEPATGAAGGKVVNFDRFEWHYILGEVDYWENPSADIVPVLQEAEGVIVQLADPYGSQGWMRINHLHAPFDNKIARQAIQLVVDKEAGYNGERMILMNPTDIATLNAASQVTAQLLREAGINVEVQAMDWSTLTSRHAEKKVQEERGRHIFHTSWMTPDLINLVADVGVSGNGKEKAVFGWSTDPEIEALRKIFIGELNENVNFDWVHCGSYPFPCPPPCPRPCPLPPPCPKCPPCPGPWCPPSGMSIGDYGNLFDKTTGVSIPPGLTRGLSAVLTDGGLLW